MVGTAEHSVPGVGIVRGSGWLAVFDARINCARRPAGLVASDTGGGSATTRPTLGSARAAIATAGENHVGCLGSQTMGPLYSSSHGVQKRGRHGAVKRQRRRQLDEQSAPVCPPGHRSEPEM